MITSELLIFLESKNKKVSRQYLDQLKRRHLKEGADYVQFHRMTDYNKSGIEKLFRILFKKDKGL